MKLILHYILFFSLTCFSCHEAERNAALPDKEKAQSFTVDTVLRETVKKNIQVISDRHSSYFQTHLEAQFLTNDVLTDSVNETDYKMESWYNITNDTIDLVAHISNFESVALLLRFIDGKTSVKFYRAPHETVGNYFRFNKGASLSHQLEVPPFRYKLELSEIPNTTLKQIVYGHIDMESGDYYDSRDSIEERHQVKMKFYFQSSPYKKIKSRNSPK